MIFVCLFVLGAEPSFDDSTVAGLVAHGQVLAEQGNHSAALEKYDKALASDQASADAHAWKAASLLQMGQPALDVAFALGYTDQSHMIKSLKQILGQTPTQLKFSAPLE